MLRIGAAKPPLGVCREREERFHRRAAAAGLAPAVRYADAAAGLLVTEFLDSDALPADTVGRQHMNGSAAYAHPRDAVALAAIAGLLRDIHRLEATPGERAAFGPVLDSAERLDEWRRSLTMTDPLPQSLGSTDLRDAVRRVSSSAITPVPCHNDLLAANRIVHCGRSYAIDWEYACLGDPYFDLAAAASELEASQRSRLLTLYLDREPADAERQRLADQLLIYRAIAACWYAAQSPP